MLSIPSRRFSRSRLDRLRHSQALSAAAVASLEAEAEANNSLPAAPKLIGVSNVQFDQPGHLLKDLSNIDASRKRVGAAIQFSLGGVALAAGGISPGVGLASQPDPRTSSFTSERIISGSVFAGLGLGSVIVGIVGVARRSASAPPSLLR